MTLTVQNVVLKLVLAWQNEDFYDYQDYKRRSARLSRALFLLVFGNRWIDLFAPCIDAALYIDSVNASLLQNA